MIINQNDWFENPNNDNELLFFSLQRFKMMQVEAVLGSLSRKGGFMFSKTDPDEHPHHPHHQHQSSCHADSSVVSIPPPPPPGKKASSTMSAKVVFLDDSTHVFDLDKKAKGQALLDAVFNHLDVHEREYFGLTFNDNGGTMPGGHSPDVMRWLDPGKFIRKQVLYPFC